MACCFGFFFREQSALAQVMASLESGDGSQIEHDFLLIHVSFFFPQQNV
jgi:hypothetical protein